MPGLDGHKTGEGLLYWLPWVWNIKLCWYSIILSAFIIIFYNYYINIKNIQLHKSDLGLKQQQGFDTKKKTTWKITLLLLAFL